MLIFQNLCEMRQLRHFFVQILNALNALNSKAICIQQNNNVLVKQVDESHEIIFPELSTALMI